MTRALPGALTRRRRTPRRVLTPSSMVVSALAAVVLVALLLVPPAPAAPASPDTGRDRKPAGSDVAALRLIERASGADATTAYEGTQFVASWGSRSSSHLLHVRHEPGRGTAVRMLGNGERSAAALREDGGAVSALDNAEALDLLKRNYDVLTSGRGSVAGREADIIDAWRRADDDRRHPVARFWLDRATGVLLRRESYDATGRTVRGSAFFDVRVDEPRSVSVAASPLAPPGPGGSDARRLGKAELKALEATGWTCPGRLADGFELREARRLPDPAGQVIHLAYSDGLATVSVFEQRGRLDDGGLDGFRRVRLGGGVVHVHDGVPQQLVWMSRDTVFTVVTDAPDETVAAVVAALPMAGQSDAGLVARLGRGLSRAVAWFAPS